MLNRIIKHSKESKEAATVIFWGTLLFLVFAFVLGGFLWPYTLHTIGTLLGRDVSISFWAGGLLSFVPWIGALTLPAAVVAWIVSLFIGA